jgi:hypothetical protein
MLTNAMRRSGELGHRWWIIAFDGQFEIIDRQWVILKSPRLDARAKGATRLHDRSST